MKRNGIFLIVLGIIAFGAMFFFISQPVSTPEDIQTFTTIFGGGGGAAIGIGLVLLVLSGRNKG